MKEITTFTLILIFIFNINVSFSQNYFGAKLTPNEIYDTLQSVTVPKVKGFLKSNVDLSKYTPPPGDQGIQSSCVAWAAAYSLRSYCEYKRYYEIPILGEDTSDWEFVYSPSFIYNQLNGGVDSGINVYEALNLMRTIGTAYWKDMKYNQNDYTTLPNARQRNLAKAHKINAFYAFQPNQLDIDTFKTILNSDNPIIVVINIDSVFCVNGNNINSKVPYTWKDNKSDTKYLHAVSIVGYDDKNSAFKVLNSWGKKWGNEGYFWIDYRFIKESNCILQAFTITVN